MALFGDREKCPPCRDEDVDVVVKSKLEARLMCKKPITRVPSAEDNEKRLRSLAGGKIKVVERREGNRYMRTDYLS